ncbi:hypothetical protein SDC9_144813 [bioreactor metagenome]|uniref:Uncharacterized protein n=1 Tax=bioreactor metagenome TaxID=1076179 RepID=A0A645E8U2_9ZZZZ
MLLIVQACVRCQHFVNPVRTAAAVLAGSDVRKNLRHLGSRSVDRTWAVHFSIADFETFTEHVLEIDQNTVRHR